MGLKTSIQNGLNKMFQKLGLIEEIPTPSAFTQSRKKLKPEFFKNANRFSIDFFYNNYEVKRWKGLILASIDCSTVDIPITEETKQIYNIQKDKNDNLVRVYGMCSCMYDVLNELPLSVELGRCLKEKDYIFNNHFPYYFEDQLSIFDRLYDDYSVISYHINYGKDFLIRSKGYTSFKAVVDFINSENVDEIIKVKVTTKQKDFVKKNNLPKEVSVRAVKVFLDSGELEVLLTSLTDKDKYPSKDFEHLYHLRWGIETYFDILKNKLDIERFSSTKMLFIEQDFYSLVFLSGMESILSKESNRELELESKNKRYIYKVNKSVSYSALMDKTVDILLSTDKSISEVIKELQILFKTNPIPIRPNRHYERKKGSPSNKLRYNKYRKKIIT